MTGARVPQTTAQAVPFAINEALKANRLAPFPPTAMSIPRSVYRAVMELAGAQVSQMGLRFTRKQLQAELSNRGYTIAGATFGNGPYRDGPPPGVPLVIYEAAKRREIISALKARAVPIAILGTAGLVIYLAWRYEKKRG